MLPVWKLISTLKTPNFPFNLMTIIPQLSTTCTYFFLEKFHKSVWTFFFGYEKSNENARNGGGDKHNFQGREISQLTDDCMLKF